MLKHKLLEFIEAKGETRYRFAKKTGIGLSNVYKFMEDPKNVPSIQSISKICEVYEVQPGDFLYFERPTP